MSEHPRVMMRYFRFEHLPPKLQAISRPFGLVADWMASCLPDCEQTRIGMQSLLDAKDRAVRGCLDVQGDVESFDRHLARLAGEALLKSAVGAGFRDG